MDRSIDVEWHVCPGDTSVQILRWLQEFMSETNHAPQSSPHVQRHHNWESRKVQDKCPGQAREMATYEARFRPVMRASQEAGLSKQWGWVKSSKQDRDALLKENVFDWLARNLQNPPTVRSEGHKIGLALDTDVSEEQCPMCTEI